MIKNEKKEKGVKLSTASICLSILLLFFSAGENVTFLQEDLKVKWKEDPKEESGIIFFLRLTYEIRELFVYLLIGLWIFSRQRIKSGLGGDGEDMKFVVQSIDKINIFDEDNKEDSNIIKYDNENKNDENKSRNKKLNEDILNQINPEIIAIDSKENLK